MKRRLNKIIAVSIAVLTCVPMFSQTVMAASDAGVIYVEDETGKKTGIESITLDGVTYYDMEQGTGDMQATDGNQIEFYKQALLGTASDSTKNDNYSGNSNQLEQWAQLAEEIFITNSDYALENHAGGSVETNYGNSWSKAGYTDLSRALASTDYSLNGEKANDCTIVRGLRYAKSLQEVRKESSRSVKDIIGKNALNREYDNENIKTDCILEAGSGKDKNHSVLNDDTEQDVLYTMVTCLDEEGGTFAYHYSSFVLAFYDFKLVPITDSNVKYLNSAQEYGSISEAAAKGADGVSYSSTEDTAQVTGVYENDSLESNQISMTLNETNSENISTTLTSGKSYSFSQTTGTDVKIGKNDNLLNVTFHSSFTTSDVINESTSNQKGKTTSTSTAVTSSLTLPAQTGVSLNSTKGSTDFTVNYDCPVAITFKVAISSMSGKLYADTIASLHTETGEYGHESFNVVFGSDDTKGGKTARENLYNRTVVNVDTAGYEEAYGQVLGWNHRISHNQLYVHAIDWGEILSDDIAPSTKGTIKPTVEYQEVDSDGKLTGKIINSYTYGTGKVPGYEYLIKPADTPTYDYSLYEENGTKHDYTATIYTGEVTDENGKTVSNDFASKDAYTKSIKISEDGDNKVVFYYQCTEPGDFSVWVKPTIEYQEVDSNGKLTGNVIKSYEYGSSLQAGQTESVTPAETSITYTLKEDSTEYSADLYTGDVTDPDGNEVENEFSDEGKTSKSITAKAVGDNIVTFYFKCDNPAKGNSSSGDGQSTTDDEETDIDKDEVTSIVEWLGNHNVLSSTGGTLTQNTTVDKTVVDKIEPLYDLEYVYCLNALDSGDYKVDSALGYDSIGENINLIDMDKGIDVESGDAFYPGQLKIAGYNKNYAAYYGFRWQLGSWQRVVKDENGKWVKDITSANDKIAKFETGSTGVQSIVTGDLDSIDTSDVTLQPDEDGNYTVYFQYCIPNNYYKAMNSDYYADNSTLTSRAVIKLNVLKKSSVSENSLSLSGDYTGTVGEEDVNLNNVLKAMVMDATDKQIQASVSWEAQELSGITVKEDGEASFTNPGTYHVRFLSGSNRSNWQEITVKSASEMNNVKFSTPEFKTKEVTLTDNRTSLSFDLPSYVSYLDQYGEEWNGDKPEVAFEFDDDYAGAEIDTDGKLTVTEPGTYKIYANAEGYNIDPITIVVKDNRTEALSLNSIEFKAPEFMTKEVTLTDTIGGLSFNLSNYLSYKDQNGNTWTGAIPTVTFELDDNYKGAAIDSTGKLTVTNPGTYKIYAKADGYIINPITITINDGRVNVPAKVSVKGTMTLVTKDSAKNLSKYMSVVLYNRAGKEIKGDYTWEAKELSGIKVTKDGKVTASKAGTYHVRAITDSGISSGWVKVKTVKISLKTPAVKSLSLKGKNAVIVSWKCNKQKIDGNNISGYQIMYSKYKSMKNAKVITVKSYKKYRKVISSLKHKTRYYVKVRAYIKYDGRNYYSDWSKRVSKKTR